MKKIFSSIIASALAVSMILTSCSDLSVSDNQANESKTVATFGKYSEFGANLKSKFEEDSARALLGQEETLAAEDEDCILLDADESSASFLLKNDYVSETAASYIERMDGLFDAEADEESIVAGIVAIEQEAIEKLSDDDLDSVMYYAEAAKAGVSVFSEYDSDTGARRLSWRKLRKIRNIVVSVAVSAVVGFGVGYAVSGGNPIVAAATAVTCGAAGGKASYDSGEICVVFKYNKS